MISFQHWKCVLLETIGRLVKMQKPSAQAQALSSLKIAEEEEAENLTQVLSEFDSLKMIMKEQGESSVQLFSDSTRKMEVEYECPADIQNELDLVRTMEEEPPHFKNEGESVSNLPMRAGERHLRQQQLEHTMQRKVKEDEDDGHFQGQLNSKRTMQTEEERPAHLNFRLKLVRTMEEEGQPPHFKNNWDHSLRLQRVADILHVKVKEDEDDSHFQGQLNSERTMEDEDERPAHFRKEGDSARTMTDEDERPALFRNEGDSVRADEHSLRLQQTEMPTIMEEDEQDAHPQDQMDPAKIKMESLPLTITEETVSHQATMESPVQMGGRRENCIAASKPTVQKKEVLMKKMGVGLAQPPNLKAVPQSSPYHRPGRSNVKMDYCKIKAKVDTWRKAPATE
jgi:hypothetical protein